MKKTSFEEFFLRFSRNVLWLIINYVSKMPRQFLFKTRFKNIKLQFEKINKICAWFIFRQKNELVCNARFYNLSNKLIVAKKMLIDINFNETKSKAFEHKAKNKMIFMLNVYKKTYARIDQSEWNLNDFKNLINETTSEKRTMKTMKKKCFWFYKLNKNFKNNISVRSSFISKTEQIDFVVLSIYDDVNQNKIKNEIVSSRSQSSKSQQQWQQQNFFFFRTMVIIYSILDLEICFSFLFLGFLLFDLLFFSSAHSLSFCLAVDFVERELMSTWIIMKKVISFFTSTKQTRSNNNWRFDWNRKNKNKNSRKKKRLVENSSQLNSDNVNDTSTK